MGPAVGDKIAAKAIGIASIVLAAVGVVSLAAWAYFIYSYVWPGGRQFDSALSIVFFLCFPPGLAILAFAALRLRPANRIAFAMVCSSLAVSIYALELFFSLAGPALGTDAANTWIDGASEDKKNEVRRLAAEFGVRFDTRDLIEVLMDAQAQGMDAVPAVYPSALLERQQDGPLKSVIKIEGAEVLPLGGISNKTTVLCNENGDYTVYESDEHGFHNPKGIWGLDHLDVAIVGDSFAQGFCVPSDKNFMALIRRRYPATLSLGMGGNGPILELAAIKEYLPSLKPKVVLWAYFGKNDLIELRNETKSPLLLQYLKPNFRQGLMPLQAEIDKALLAYVEKEKLKALRRAEERKNQSAIILLKSLLDFAKLRTLRARLRLVSGQKKREEEPGTQADRSADMALFRAVLLQAKINVEAWGGSLYFLYLPEWERYALPHRVKQNRKQVLAVAAGLKIPVIDIHETFQSHPDVLSLFPFRRSGHYNVDGNRVVAEPILKRLSEQ
ncbi:MAG: hypothetical protein ACREQV_04115 [Candidatus Binatia bacterium]